MRKFRILLFEVIGFAVLIGWLMWKYPELVDDIIPWVALGIAWHLTWEYIFDTNVFRRWGIVLEKRVKPMIAWPLIFLLGGCVSLLYWKGINKSLVRLSKIAATRAAEKKVGGKPSEVPLGTAGSTPENKPGPHPEVENPLPTVAAKPSSPPKVLPKFEKVPLPLVDAAETARRQQLLDTLRQEYIAELTKRRIVPGMKLLFQNELPPTAWTNEKLRQLGEHWKITNRYADMPPNELRKTASKFIERLQEMYSGYRQASHGAFQRRLESRESAKTDEEKKQIDELYNGQVDMSCQIMNANYEECCKRDAIELRDALMDRVGPGAMSNSYDAYERITRATGPGIIGRNSFDIQLIFEDLDRLTRILPDKP